MVRKYFNILRNTILATGITKKNFHNNTYVIRTLRGGRLHKMIGINNVKKVKKLTIFGKINVNDLYFIQHMDNLECLNLQKTIYLRKIKNDAIKSKLRRDLVKKKQYLKKIYFPNSIRTVPSGLFYNCQKLELVILPNKLRYTKY